MRREKSDALKKVHIITFAGSVNYGAALQGYALYKTVSDLGYACEVIDYNRGRHHKNYVCQMSGNMSIKGKCVKLLTVGKRYPLSRKFNSFVVKHEQLSRMYNGRGTLKSNVWNPDDIYLVGSDQVFNLDMTGGDFHYFLDFTNSPNKIAYAPSFGTTHIPTRYKDKCAERLREFKMVTVREESGAALIKELTGLSAHIVLDPCFLLSQEEWCKVLVRPNEDGYVLIFTLISDDELISQAKSFARNKNLTLYNIVYNSQEVIGAINLYNLSPEEWGGYFRNAERIYTNSFHGMVFSLIFHRQFVVGLDKGGGRKTKNSRIVDLLTRIGVDRIHDLNESSVDYAVIGPKLETEIQKSFRYLEEMLNLANGGQGGMVTGAFQIYDKKRNCSGCTACASACPVNAICMKADEKGFLYPQVDYLVCIHCNKCMQICPIRNKQRSEEKGNNTEKEQNIRCFAMRLTDEEKLSKSTSGGVFRGLAEAVIEAGGSVYGAAYGNDNIVTHIRVDSVDALWKLQGSKYVQSNVRGIFCQVKADLEANRQVLFSGTACQIEGLYAFLGHKYETLITIDVICFGVPSPMLWRKFLREEYKNYSECSFNMRDKISGWKNSSFTVERNGQRIGQCKNNDVSFLRVFYGAYGLRDSCYACAFKNLLHKSDLTIGDCWAAETLGIEMAQDDKGLSLVVVNSDKGMHALVHCDGRFWHKEIDETVLQLTPLISKSVTRPIDEDVFWMNVSGKTMKKAAYCAVPGDPIILRLKKRLYWIKQAVVENQT